MTRPTAALRRPLARRAVGVFAALSALLLVGCSSTPGGTWTTDVVLDAGSKVGGCAIGDVLPQYPGPEIVAVDVLGRLHVAHRASADATAWTSEIVTTFPGEAIQCVVGDVDPRHAGPEIVAVGKLEGDEDSPGPGAIYVVSHGDSGWSTEVAHESAALVHGVAIGSAGTTPGEHILTVGYTRRATTLHRGPDDDWVSFACADLPGDGKSCAFVDAADGQTIAVAGCADGSRVTIRWPGPASIGDAASALLHDAGSSQARLAAGPAPGEVLACRNDGVLALVDEAGAREVYREADRLRGAVCHELDDTVAGPELATAGYSGAVTVLTRAGDGWAPTEVARDTDKLHHLAAGDFPGLGAALVTCGYSGKVLLVSKR